MTKGIRRLVLDILKPHAPILPEMAMRINSMDSVHGVNITLVEIDKKTENVKVTMEGVDIDYDEAKVLIEGLGANIHSIDEVVVGSRMVEKVETPQDR